MIVVQWVAILTPIILNHPPFDAALIALAPLWQKADFNEIEDFLFGWEVKLRSNDDQDIDIRAYIEELDSLVTQLMHR